MRTIGKLLQVAGLVLLPVAIMMQLSGGVRAPTGGGFTVSAMLILMVAGVALFCLGRIVEGYAGSQELVCGGIAWSCYLI